MSTHTFRILETGTHSLLNLYADDASAGCIRFNVSDDTLCIEDVFIEPEHRKTLLLLHGIQHLLASAPASVRFVDYYVDKQPESALAINLKLGTTVVAEEETRWRVRSDIETMKRIHQR